MKKFFIGLIAVLGMALVMTSCKPEGGSYVQFQLNVEGVVLDSATSITSNFYADVMNTDLSALSEANGLQLITDEVIINDQNAMKVSSWVDEVVDKSVKAQFGENAKTKYRVHVVGVVKEPDITGAEFKIDKTITNM